MIGILATIGWIMFAFGGMSLMYKWSASHVPTEEGEEENG